MAAGSTYTPISSTTLGSSASSVTFSSLGSYTDIVLIASTACTTDDNTIAMQFNSDAGTNYSATQMRGTGSSAVSSRTTNASSIAVAKDSNPTSTLGEHNLICHIMNYGNSNTYKTVISRSNRATSGTYTGAETAVGVWRNTAAITSITLRVGTNFLTGSTFTLYGITAA